MHSFIRLVIVLTVFKNSLANVVPTINCGVKAKSGQFPWFASLLLQDKHLCGGFLISNKFVLTAGHCIVDNFDSVALGNTNVNQKCIVKKVKQIIIHPDYYLDKEKKNITNDIALIELETPVIFSNTIKPIKLATRKDGNLDGKESFIAGFGWNEREYKVL